MNIVRELRKRAGYGQKELAALVGASVATVSDWETQKKDPSGVRLRNLAGVFGVDELVILGVVSPSVGGSVQEDNETMAIRERLRRDPAYRLLFDAAGSASPEHLRAAAAMLKVLEGSDADGR